QLLLAQRPYLGRKLCEAPVYDIHSITLPPKAYCGLWGHIRLKKAKARPLPSWNTHSDAYLSLTCISPLPKIRSSMSSHILFRLLSRLDCLYTAPPMLYLPARFCKPSLKNAGQSFLRPADIICLD